MKSQIPSREERLASLRAAREENMRMARLRPPADEAELARMRASEAGLVIDVDAPDPLAAGDQSLSEGARLAAAYVAANLVSVANVGEVVAAIVNGVGSAGRTGALDIVRRSGAKEYKIDKKPMASSPSPRTRTKASRLVAHCD